VVSGPVESIETLAGRLEADDCVVRRLRGRRAFHSPAVEPMLEPLAERLRAIELRPPRIPYLSNLTGTWIRPEEATDPDYWVEHSRRTVRFGDAVAELAREPRRVLLEVGPGRTLTSLARQHEGRDPRQLLVPSLPGSGGEAREGAGRPEMLEALGRLWCSGVEVDWHGVHDGETRHRIRLPGYPFESARYWIDPAPERRAAGAVHSGAGGPVPRRKRVADWLYVPSWRRLPPLELRPPAGGADPADPETSEPTHTWLLLAPEGGAGAEPAGRLRECLIGHGATVVTVRPAAPGAGLDRPAETAEGAWTLDAEDGEAWRELLGTLDAAGSRPDRVAHLWTLDGADGPETADGDRAERFEARRRLGFSSLVHLARALSDDGTSRPVRIVTVTDGLDEVVGGEPLIPDKATLCGACRVVPQEHPEIECRVIDAGALDAEELADTLAAEVTAEEAPARTALRGGIRWTPGFEALPGVREASRTADSGRAPLRLRRGGVYLIFGGLGRIGLTLAEWLLRDLDARVVLAARHAPPDPDRWDAWVEEHGPDDPERVHTLCADVSDEAQVRAAVAAAHERYGTLHGVIHAAGVTRSFQPVRETTAETSELHFRPKVGGCFALDAALADEDLDFVLLLSSLSAVLGGIGYAAHSAAHRFLDAFALERSRSGRFPWLSVGLDGWRFGDGGGDARRRPGTSSAAELAMTPSEGVEAIGRFLDRTGVRHALISTGDLTVRAERTAAGAPAGSSPAGGDAGETSADAADGAVSAHPRPALQNAFVAPETETEGLIAEIWQELLGVEPVGVTDDFFELGGHSLLGVQIVSRLREVFQVEVPMRRVFERTTVRGLAETVETVLVAEIETMTDEEAERLLGGALQ
jgi:acyl transferase domain-containing protein/acyl carrier protein